FEKVVRQVRPHRARHELARKRSLRAVRIREMDEGHSRRPHLARLSGPPRRANAARRQNWNRGTTQRLELSARAEALRRILFRPRRQRLRVSRVTAPKLHLTVLS